MTLTDPNLIAAQANLTAASARIAQTQSTLDALNAPNLPLMLTDLQSQSVILAQRWQQICDSQGPHEPAALSWLPSDRMSMVWRPTVRTQQQVDEFGWDNLYMWRVIPVTAKDSMIYDLGMQFSSMQGLNVPEHELHAVRDGKIYNTGLQYGRTVRIFNFSTKAWVDTGIPMLPSDFTTGIETRLVVLCRLLTDTVRFETISINGRMATIGKEFPVVPTTGADHVNVSWQVDGNNTPAPIAAVYRADVFGD